MEDKGITTPSARARLIEDNPEWKSIRLTLLKDTLMYDKSSKEKIECTCRKGTLVKIQSPKLSQCGPNKKSKCVLAKIGQSGPGYVMVSHILKPDIKTRTTDTKKAERAAMKQLDKILKEKVKCLGEATICTPIGNIVGACGVEELKGTPKADFAIVDKKGKEIFWISHKKTGGAKAFQQYGGVSKSAGRKISTHEQTQEFLRQTSAYVDEDQLQVPVMKEIKDENLIRMSVFGPDADGNSTKFGKNNCHVLGQGNAVMTWKNDNCWDLKWEHTVWNDRNGVDAFTKGDGYQAVFGATFRKDRGFTYMEQKYKGARVGIYPKALMEGRTNVIVLKDA